MRAFRNRGAKKRTSPIPPNPSSDHPVILFALFVISRSAPESYSCCIVRPLRSSPMRRFCAHCSRRLSPITPKEIFALSTAVPRARKGLPATPRDPIKRCIPGIVYSVSAPPMRNPNFAHIVESKSCLDLASLSNVAISPSATSSPRIIASMDTFVAFAQSVGCR